MVQKYNLHDYLMNNLFRSIGDTQHTFPFYNVTQWADGGQIQLSLAGYTKNDIKVTLDGKILTITGKKDNTEDDKNQVGIKHLHRGITYRPFTKQFHIGDYWEISDVNMSEGILNINLVFNIPEEKQPKSFDIK